LVSPQNTGVMINLLIVGSGGREHALLWKFSQSPLVSRIFIAPGNGGMPEQSVPISATDIPALIEFARSKKCFTVVGPEQPLSMGIVDEFVRQGLPIFGPSRIQAQLETSKSFAKRFMKEHSIPTAEFGTFDNSSQALDYASKFDGNVAVKANGLAAGKGVFVCSSMEEARRAINIILENHAYGHAGDSVVVERKLHGREVSLMTLCNGREAIPLGTATDHKRLLDGGKGPNTGGMGAYSPSAEFGRDEVDKAMEKVIAPTVKSTGFIGFLYAGLMLTESGTSVLEFNVRMGDPEAQAILPRLQSDLLATVLKSSNGESITESDVVWSKLRSCCVAMCARGYPDDPKLGDPIHGLEKTQSDNLTFLFHSGTKKIGDELVTSGGRVLYVASLGSSIEEASARAYATVDKISWLGEHHRRDIGKNPLDVA
jgi:phosphoribosylamine---glycine ligase